MSETEYTTFDQTLEDKQQIAYVAHSGIKGMKWGVKNGPPYPLSPEKHAMVVSRASEHERGESSGKANTKRKSKRRGSFLDDLDEYRTNRKIRREKLKTERTLQRLKRQAAMDDAKKISDAKALELAKKQWMKSPKEMRQHLDQFTDAELAAYVSKLNKDKEIADLQLAKVKRGVDYMTNAYNVAKIAVDLADKLGERQKRAADAYNKKQAADKLAKEEKYRLALAAYTDLTKIDRKKLSDKEKAAVEKLGQQYVATLLEGDKKGLLPNAAPKNNQQQQQNNPQQQPQQQNNPQQQPQQQNNKQNKKKQNK